MLFENFLTQLRDSGIGPSTDRLLLAVSGGIDSMVLLHLFSQTDFCVAVAHCNFCLRGEASDGDERLVRDAAASYGMPLHVIRFDTEKYAAEKKISIQMAARELRYDWFDALCREHGYTRIVTAHHGDDDIETFFINLGRGSGIRGLDGMAAGPTARIVRPLLAADRPAIAAYAAEHHVAYREDASNASDKYVRNKIRHHLLPVMEDIFPQYREGMRHSMHLLSETAAVLDRYVQLASAKYVSESADGVSIDLSFRTQEPSPQTLLYEMLRPYGFSPGLVQSAWTMIEKDTLSGRECSNGAWRLLTERGRLLLVPQKVSEDEQFSITSDMTELTRPLRWHMEWADMARFKLSRSPLVGQFDADKTVFPLTLRHWRPGDWFCPLGMRGRQKLSDYWINHKCSLPEKTAQWLLCSGQDIIWIPGQRIDDRFKVTSETRRVLIITLNA